MKVAAIYARVSSEQQKEENTSASQTAALIDFAREQGYSVPDDWVIEDEGLSGASLLRPGLERLRDLAAEGHIQILCSGRQNSGKSTSPITEPRKRPMQHATTLPAPERTCSRGNCATLFVSLELSRSTWIATALAPGSSKMSKHALVGGDGRKLLG